MIGLEDAAKAILSGEPIAFPTETVYGLGAIAFDAAAISRVFERKGRPASNPLIVHVASIEQAWETVSEWPSIAQTLAEKFWPGPLTLVLPKADSIPDAVTAGGSTVAVRCPDHPVARELIARTGAPLVGPSANPSGTVSPTAAMHVVRSFEGAVRVIDGGLCDRGIESTVLDLTTAPPAILRPGSLSRGEITNAIGYVEGVTVRDRAVAKSPGLQDRHYAPGTPAELFDGQDWPEILARAYERVGGPIALITHRAERFAAPPNQTFFLAPDPVSYGKTLYAALRSADAQSPRLILIERVPNTDDWVAIADRLSRATQPK